MDGALILTLVVGFVAVVALLEGGYLIWNDSRGPEVQRLERRVRMVSAGAAGSKAADLLKKRRGQDAPALTRLLLSLPRVAALDRFVAQAGLTFGIGQLLSIVLLCAVIGTSLAVLVRAPWLFVLIFGAAMGALPLVYVWAKRERRLRQMEAQLPDTIELMARALRAGHSFPAAVQMVSDDSPEPLGGEFRIVHDETSFGLSMDEAFRNLAARVPSDDIRFFVIAVLLQRETGGNLSEVLINIANLVRSRFKLLARVKVLSAEGRLSAWVLGGMPVAIAAMIYAVNPEFMSLLWKDPAGIKAIYACIVMFGVGLFWVWRLVKIRV